MDIRLKQLRAIVAVADERSFTDAGKLLTLSQQSVSALIRDIELDMGVKLFRRTTRNVEPTSVCLALVADIRAALNLLDSAFACARQTGDTERPLKLAITPAIAFGEINDLWTSLEGRFEIMPDVREAWGDEMIAGLVDGRFDAGICIDPPRTPGLRIVPWRQHRIDLMVSERHPFASLKSVEVRQLQGHTVVIPGYATNSKLRKKLLDTMIKAGVSIEFVDAPRVSGPAPLAVERGRAVTIWLTSMDDKYVPTGHVHVPLRTPETFVSTVLVLPEHGNSVCPNGAAMLERTIGETKTST